MYLKAGEKDFFVNASRILAIIDYEGLPIQKLLSEAKDKGVVLDFTGQHKCMSLIVCDTGVVVKTPYKANILLNRLDKLTN